MKKFIILLVAVGISTGCAICLAACAGGGAEYSITCETSYNGRVLVADNSVKAGENVILASKPDRGYKLAAYYLDGEELDGCSFTMPERDVSVYAEFEIIAYTLTFDFGDRTEKTEYTVNDSALKFEAPEKDGYEICGWYTYFIENEWESNYDEYRVTSLEGLYGNVTLYAKFYNPWHEIICGDSQNGWFHLENYDNYGRYGDKFTVITEPNTGYEIDYIAVNGEPIAGNEFEMPKCDVEVTAVFKPVEYTIDYVLYGGENDENNPLSFTVEDGMITLNVPTKDGFEFIGWFLDEEFSENFCADFDPYSYLQPLTLHALFIEI